MSLLDKAKEVKSRKRTSRQITDEGIELAIAYLKGEVNQMQVGVAIKKAVGAGAYIWILLHLVEAYKKGLIKIV